MAYCLNCKKEVGIMATECPHCHQQLSDNDSIYKVDKYLYQKRFIITFALLLLWIFYLFYSSIYYKNAGELILSLFFSPISIFCAGCRGTSHTPSPLIYHIIHNDLIAIAAFCIISFLGCYLYSCLIIKRKRFWVIKNSNPIEHPLPLNELKKIAILVLVVFLASFIKFPEKKYDPSMYRMSCASNLKQISLALRQYSMDYDDTFPPYNGAKGLNLLIELDYLSDKHLYACPAYHFSNSSWKRKSISLPLTDENLSYVYYGGHKETDPKNTIICRDKDDSHQNYGNALYLDGSVGGLRNKRWQVLINKD